MYRQEVDVHFIKSLVVLCWVRGGKDYAVEFKAIDLFVFFYSNKIKKYSPKNILNRFRKTATCFAQ